METLQTQLYHLQQFSDRLVSTQLHHLSAISITLIFLAGLLTSLTPCMLSMLPLTLAYMGGYNTHSSQTQSPTRTQAAVQSLAFAAGLATTLALLGIFAALFGQVYGQIGIGLPIVVSILAILMGLNLLEALPLQLPAWGGTDWISPTFPKTLRSYLMGLTFGIVASPCSTPVLATLLAWVSTTENPLLGSGLLLAYTAGYVSPLVIAGTFTATIKKLLALRQWSGWITPTSGVLLVGFGVFSLLSRLVPIS